MKEQKNPKTTSHCSIGKFGVPFLSSCDSWDFRLQTANTTFRNRSSASLGTRAALEHRLARWLKPVCRTGAPQHIGWWQRQLPCTQLLLQVHHRDPSSHWLGDQGSWTTLGLLALYHTGGKKNKTPKPCKLSRKTETFQNICLQT